MTMDSVEGIIIILMLKFGCVTLSNCESPSTCVCVCVLVYIHMYKCMYVRGTQDMCICSSMPDPYSLKINLH